MARCTQCGRFLKRDEADAPDAAGRAPSTYSAAPRGSNGSATATSLNPEPEHPLGPLNPLTDDDWLLDQQMARLRRQFNLPMAVSEPPAKPRSPSLVRRATAIGSWAILFLGLAALACGGGLVAWSLHTLRSDLWNIGLPAALGGQLGVLLGLVLLIDHLSHANRRTTAELADIQARLAKLDQPMLASPSTFRSAVMATSPNCRGPIRQMAGLSNSTETHAA